ncbi:DegV family protein [Oscillospiraceae bacterium LTW-04]|nr:DegV family protein [Oscillospiraceae bacterium MB24-C1]
MDKFCIVTESTADLTPALIDRFNVTVIPMRFSFEDKEYYNYPDNRELSSEAFYQMLREGHVSTTTAINMSQFEEAFVPILERGEDILYLAFSSGLSSTFGTAVMVLEQLQERYPLRKIVVIDTLAASMGEGLLVCLAAIKKQDGASLSEVADWVRANILKLCHWFTVDDLMYLYRGGRVNALTAHVGTAFGIKPILHVDNDGHLIPAAKVRGRKQSIEALADKIGELGTEISKQMIFIGHAEAADAAQMLADMINKRFSPKEIQIASIGPVVGSHTGPGLVSVFFMGTGR